MARNKCPYLTGFLFFCLMTTTTFVYAVDVTYNGYFRSRGNYQYNLDLDRSNSPNIRAFTDFRFRLDPSFFITDKIRIRSSLNFLDGHLGDQPYRVNPHNNPAQSHNRLLGLADSEALVGKSTNPQSSYGGIYAADGAVQSSGLTPIQLRRAWAEIEIPFGLIKAGRMPNHFGMGLFANAGDEPYQEVGSSRDRIAFETAFGPYYVQPGVGWLYEGYLDQSADDVYEYFLIFGRKTEREDLGFYLSYQSQDSAGATDPNGVATNGSVGGLDTSYWAFDFYGMGKFELATLMGEVVLFSGKFLGRDLLALNSAVRADWNLGKWKLLNEVGYSSGTSDSDVTNNEIKTFAFSRDYDIALIIFEEALPGGPSLKNSSGAESGSASAPHSGAVANAVYARLRFGYDVADFFQPYVNVVLPYAMNQAGGAGGKFYGVEYDLMTLWPINPHWEAEFSFGHLIPGSFYDQVSKSQSAVLMRLGITAKF